MTPLKDAFELARLAGNIDLVLPAFRKAELYVIVRPDPVDPGKQVFFLVPSPKGRQSVTVSESLDTLQSVSWPKRRMTGAQLLAELPPDRRSSSPIPTAAITSTANNSSGSDSSHDRVVPVLLRGRDDQATS